MEDSVRLNRFQEFLTQKFLEYQQGHTSTYKRKIGDAEFSRWLGVSNASFNSWINGVRLPDYENAIRLSKRLGRQVFDILGYDHVLVTADKEVIFIADNWRFLEDDTRNEIITAIKEELENRRRKQDTGPVPTS